MGDLQQLTAVGPLQHLQIARMRALERSGACNADLAGEYHLCGFYFDPVDVEDGATVAVALLQAGVRRESVSGMPREARSRRSTLAFCLLPITPT